ncbi:MAG: 4-(cytidine 5'-diphospho)-2-C-methyl-D-erythritol kinase [Francisellaceae bacterium]
MISYPSYAKINLFLHITGKRSDGYHNLQTWFQFIDLKDSLSFSKNNSNTITLQSDLAICNDEDNLILRAAKLIQPHAKDISGMDINIEKHIPMGAGLGGGSSNAATTLIALNHLWQCGLTHNQLSLLGKTLGADVPIFLFQKAAWAEGIGEILTPKPYIEQHALIMTPRFHASTAMLFNHPKLHKHSPLLKNETIHDIGELDNVFLPILQDLLPEIDDYFKDLPDKASLRLSGTGSSFYLLGSDIERLRENQKKLQKHVDSWIVKTVNFAPVEEM